MKRYQPFCPRDAGCRDADIMQEDPLGDYIKVEDFKKQKKTFKIKGGLFFASDFKKMSKRNLLYIKKGKLIVY